jgi:NitT/TauT family transport system permease protein
MPRSRDRGWALRIGVALGFLALVVLVWEGAKFIGGDPWRLGTWEWRPPLDIKVASDLNLPHVWDILGALAAPVQRNQDESLAGFLVGAALYTWREAAIGFVAGGLLGVALAAVFVHVPLIERALVPYVIASQTIPIVALAPMIVFAFGPDVTSVVIIATYLTFFPVTIAMLRGLRSPDPRSLELMRSYAASRRDIFWKLRMPASAPYLFTALKISATASIVGAIIGEGPGGIRFGLGRAIINFNNQYISGPEKLWAAILVAAILGIAFFGLVRLAELVTLRGRGATA